LLALLLTPIQTSAEEPVLPRLPGPGGEPDPQPGLPGNLVRLLFTLPHILNPEVAANASIAIDILRLGAFLAGFRLKMGRSAALGAAANNLYAGLVVTFPDLALATPALFFTTHFDPLFTLANVVIACLIFY
jgi:hypothetical protein